MGFSRQEHWSGLPFSCHRDLPDPGIKPRCPALHADSLPTESPVKPPNTNFTGEEVPKKLNNQDKSHSNVIFFLSIHAKVHDEQHIIIFNTEASVLLNFSSTSGFNESQHSLVPDLTLYLKLGYSVHHELFHIKFKF